MQSLTNQVGGSHYQKYAIQPMEYIIKNRLPFAEGCVVKYVTRWRDKNGIEDLKKARQNLDILIEEAELELAEAEKPSLVSHYPVSPPFPKLSPKFFLRKPPVGPFSYDPLEHKGDREDDSIEG